MAQAVTHPFLTGLSGKSGGLVFRQVAGKVVVAQTPTPTEAAPSEQQLARRERFRAARLYAKAVLAEPYQRRAYEARARALRRRADQLLISDYLNPPKVDLLDTAEYHGLPGGVIRVLATDDIEVVSVEVTIATSGGTILECGAATNVHDVWLYNAGTTAPDGERLMITAVAKDRPGNEATASTSWPN